MRDRTSYLRRPRKEHLAVAMALAMIVAGVILATVAVMEGGKYAAETGEFPILYMGMFIFTYLLAILGFGFLVHAEPSGCSS